MLNTQSSHHLPGSGVSFVYHWRGVHLTKILSNVLGLGKGLSLEGYRLVGWGTCCFHRQVFDELFLRVDDSTFSIQD
jgi:hypothetical protein